jgi:hypothetical protein
MEKFILIALAFAISAHSIGPSPILVNSIVRVLSRYERPVIENAARTISYNLLEGEARQQINGYMLENEKTLAAIFGNTWKPIQTHELSSTEFILERNRRLFDSIVSTDLFMKNWDPTFLRMKSYQVSKTPPNSLPINRELLDLQSEINNHFLSKYRSGCLDKIGIQKEVDQFILPLIKKKLGCQEIKSKVKLKIADFGIDFTCGTKVLELTLKEAYIVYSGLRDLGVIGDNKKSQDQTEQ